MTDKHTAGGLLSTRTCFKPFKYPWAYEAFMQSEQMHWLWTEVPMLEDVKDYGQKLTDSDAQQKIHDELVYQTANSEDMASVRALKENLGQIRFFVSSVGQYADGVAAAAEGAHTAKEGSARLAGGASALYDGVLQLQSGTDQLNGGLVQFNAEGISQLTGALDADQLHALQAVVEEMTSRLAGYTSFAGAPEGASSRVKFIYKTAETPAETAPVETAADNATEGNFFVRLWHRLLAMFGL